MTWSRGPDRALPSALAGITVIIFELSLSIRFSLYNCNFSMWWGMVALGLESSARLRHNWVLCSKPRQPTSMPHPLCSLMRFLTISSTEEVWNPNLNCNSRCICFHTNCYTKSTYAGDINVLVIVIASLLKSKWLVASSLLLARNHYLFSMHHKKDIYEPF